MTSLFKIDFIKQFIQTEAHQPTPVKQDRKTLKLKTSDLELTLAFHKQSQQMKMSHSFHEKKKNRNNKHRGLTMMTLFLKYI